MSLVLQQRHQVYLIATVLAFKVRFKFIDVHLDYLDDIETIVNPWLWPGKHYALQCVWRGFIAQQISYTLGVLPHKAKTCYYLGLLPLAFKQKHVDCNATQHNRKGNQIRSS